MANASCIHMNPSVESANPCNTTVSLPAGFGAYSQTWSKGNSIRSILPIKYHISDTLHHFPMIEQRRRGILIAFFTLLLVIDASLYFRHAGHFFQADTIFDIDHRASSIGGYFREFVVLNPSGWFRPLAAELFESILYPIAGWTPLPYQIPVYVLFLAITVAFFRLACVLTKRKYTAMIATFFFTIHTANAYTTYDLAFMPELLFALFYIGATLFFLRYMQTGSSRAYGLSIVCYVAGLLSKESSVTLPGVLLLAAK